MDCRWPVNELINFSANATQPALDPDGGLPNLLVVLPHLRPGGIETATLGLLNALHGTRARTGLILARREGALLPQLRPEIPVIDLAGTRAAASIRRLARLLARDCDIVYSGTNARNLATLAALRLIPRRQRPVAIISEHTTPAEYLAQARARGLRRAAMRMLYPDAAALAVPSDGLGLAWLKTLDIQRPVPVTLPNPILSPDDIALSDAVAAGQGPGRDPNRIVAAGRLHPAKGFDLLIDAFACAAAERPELRLDLYGDGELRTALQARINTLALQDKVRLRGHSDALLREIAGAGLFVVPSRREGFGNVVVEALAVGTPVLATACAGPSALLAQAPGAGSIVPVGDVAALCAGMIEMAGDRGFTDAAGETGPALARPYSTHSAAQVFADLMDNLIAARR